MNLNVLKYFPIMPEQASSFAGTYDLLFWWITFLAVFFGVIVVVLMLWLATKYRRGSLADRRNPIDHHTKLEMVIIGVCTVLALVTFWWSMHEYIKYRKMPTDGIEVFVMGKQWMWHVQHTNGIRENNELHLPVDTNVKFTMISQDVIHAFYLPEFRAQYHVVPGRYTDMWVRPTKVGRYRLLCAMHCGTQHSEMVGWVYVMPKNEYAAWLASGGDRTKPQAMTMASAGKKLWDGKGCGNCHGGQDTVRGPSVNGLFGTNRTMDDGSVVKADNEYLRESILTPWKRLTKGYSATMPAYQGQLSEEDVLNLVAYMKAGSATTEPGRKAPYVPSVPNETRLGPSRDKSAIDQANEAASAGMSQSDQGDAPK